MRDKAAACAELQGKIDAAEERKQGAEQELAEAQQALTTAQNEAAELRANSGASANAIIESCEKRLKILEYDLVSKQEEIAKLEKVCAYVFCAVLESTCCVTPFMLCNALCMAASKCTFSMRSALTGRAYPLGVACSMGA